MIGYLDTSVVVPLLIHEPSTQACQKFWIDCDKLVSVPLLYVEAAAALAAALRAGRISDATHRTALRDLDRLWSQMLFVDIDEPLIQRAADLAHRCALRGDDAVHAAAAAQLADADMVAAAGDVAILRAWQFLGISTYDTNANRSF